MIYCTTNRLENCWKILTRLRILNSQSAWLIVKDFEEYVRIVCLVATAFQ